MSGKTVATAAKPAAKPTEIRLVKPNQFQEVVNAHNSTKHWCIGIMIGILVVMIVYVVVMFEMYLSSSWIFAAYVPATPPAPYFYPLGKVTPLTKEQQDARNDLINASRASNT